MFIEWCHWFNDIHNQNHIHLTIIRFTALIAFLLGWMVARQTSCCNKCSYKLNHRPHHASIFGTVLAKCLLVPLNRVSSKMRAWRTDSSEKESTCKIPRFYAGCNSAMDYKQCSRFAAWILQWYCIIFTRSRQKRVDVSSLLARWKNVQWVSLNERYWLVACSWRGGFRWKVGNLACLKFSVSFTSIQYFLQ